ncbi:MAG TPA: P22 phage major capsid protein family protein [Burkholderiaceae bacterium]|nr:P22 phage major capsid protein family protein [Burkholderiaceae bacterium]
MLAFLRSLGERAGDLLFGLAASLGLVLANNTLLTISFITNEALMVLENELTFSSQVNREYDDRFAVDGAKIGDTANIRRPPRFIGTFGPNLNVEDINETSVPVTLANQFHVDFQMTTKDRLLSMDNFRERVIQPAVATIANKIDLYGLIQMRDQTANTVGVAGTPPSGLITYLQAAAYLDSEAAPRDGRRAVVVEPWTSAAIVDSLKGLFVPAEKLSNQFQRGLMGRDSAGMNWFMDQNVITHTYGAWASVAGTLTMSGANQGLATGWASTSTLTLTTNQTLTLQKGDTFQIANVFAVNPQSRQSYRQLRHFVVQQAVTAASGAFQVTVSPALIYGGQFQNVTASPGATAAIQPFSLATGTANAIVSPQNVLFHRNAVTLAMADLPLPRGVNMSGRASSKEAGLSLRIVEQYTINNDALPCRIDSLWGWASLYNELGARVAA